MAGVLVAASAVPALGPAVAQSNTPAQTQWNRLPAQLVAALLVRRTLLRSDGSRIYLLPSGSAYRERAGLLDYLRWGVVGDHLCLQDRQRKCYAVERNARQGLRLVGQGRSEKLGLRDGDATNLVWRYGLSLRTALARGQLALGQPRSARRAADNTTLVGQPEQTFTQRSLPVSSLRSNAARQPRFGRSKDVVAKDGTIGRFAIRPQGSPSILPSFGKTAATLPPEPQINQAAAAQTAIEPAARPSTPLLFSTQIDKDPGCYAQLQHCQSRCQTVRARNYAKSSPHCATNCLDTYICTR